MMGMREAIGETEFEQQQILGYAPVEPDGSFKLHVPADTPIALAIVDAKGRAFQTHTQLDPGSPGRTPHLRRLPQPAPRRRAELRRRSSTRNAGRAGCRRMASAHQSGETMASTRTRLDPTALQLQADMVSTDVWADTAAGGVPRASIAAIRYTGNASRGR